MDWVTHTPPPSPQASTSASTVEHSIDPTQAVTANNIPVILAAFETWLKHHVAPRKHAPAPSTVRAYLSDSAQFLHWLAQQPGGPVPEWFAALRTHQDAEKPSGTDATHGIPLLLVTQQVVQTYLEFLSAPGHRGTGGSNAPRAADGRYRPTTLAKKRAALQTFFTFTQQNHLTVGHPLEEMAEVIALPQDVRTPAEKITALTRAQAERLLTAVLGACVAAPSPLRQAQAIRDRVMIELMLLHGLRNIEVHRLNIADYVPNVQGELGTLTLTGRGEKVRTLVLCPEMQAELDQWLAVRMLYGCTTPALFVNFQSSTGQDGTGRRLSQRSIRERVDVYLRKAGLKRPGVSCHTLRHTYATLYVAAKGPAANPYVLAASLGHNNIAMTDVYVDWVTRTGDNPSQPLMELHRTAQQHVKTPLQTDKKR